MKQLLSRIIMLSVVVLILVSCAADKQVTLLFTNDTHSQIVPIKDNDKYYPAMGGVERRKVLVDSLRVEYPQAILVDAGDAVQGTPFFNVFGGEVETMVMNELGYDVRTLGNHEFDNGAEALAGMLRAYDGVVVSSNYTYLDTILGKEVQPAWIKEVDGVKVGFIGLNVNPNDLFVPRNAACIAYNDPIAIADSLALILRNDGADIVVALSHLGYTAESVNYPNALDSTLVQHTRYIDVVIGAHSHTRLDAPTYHTNADGRSIIVGQTGDRGAYVGCMNITLPAGKREDMSVTYRLLPVDKRYDNRLDEAFVARLLPYKEQVDSVMSIVIGHNADTLYRSRPESPLSNWACDAFVEVARLKSGVPVDFAVLNVGGIRNDIAPGTVTLGQMWEVFPFANHMMIIRLKGSEVLELFGQIAARGGEGVSREVRMTIADGMVEQVTVGGNPIDEDRYYNVATLNFLAYGGDGMKAFTKGEVVTELQGYVFDIFTQYIKALEARGEVMRGALDGRIIVKQ